MSFNNKVKTIKNYFFIEEIQLKLVIVLALIKDYLALKPNSKKPPISRHITTYYMQFIPQFRQAFSKLIPGVVIFRNCFWLCERSFLALFSTRPQKELKGSC